MDGLPTWVRWIIVGAAGLCPIHLEEPPRAAPSPPHCFLSGGVDWFGIGAQIGTGRLRTELDRAGRFDGSRRSPE